RPHRDARGEDQGQPDGRRRAPAGADPLRPEDALRRAIEDEVSMTPRFLVACLLAAAACGHSQPGEDGHGSLPPGATPVPTASALPVATVAPPAAPAAPLAVMVQPVSFAPIAKLAAPSVVTITTVAVAEEVSPFTHRRRQALAQGLGTGFVIDKTGIILTNNHVVTRAQSIEVKLLDERTFP